MKAFVYTSTRWTVLVCAMWLAACSTQPSIRSDISETEVADDIGQKFSLAVVQASAASWAAKDVEHLVSLYTDDAVLFPPKGDPIKGRDAIRAYWTRAPDRRILEHSIETERADASGDSLLPGRAIAA